MPFPTKWVTLRRIESFARATRPVSAVGGERGCYERAIADHTLSQVGMKPKLRRALTWYSAQSAERALRPHVRPFPPLCVTQRRVNAAI